VEQEGTWPTNARYVGEDGSSYQSLQSPLEYSNDTALQSNPTIEGTGTFLAGTETNPHVFQCRECTKTFSKKHLLNKHFKEHNPPFRCMINGCNKPFLWKRDYDRHLNAKHPQTVPGLTIWSCPIDGCKFSIQRNGGSSRKDNMDRHKRTQHGV